MNINTDYLEKVRRMAALYTRQKTSDLLDGSFSSRQHGRSLDFDDLREYRPGDEVGDIDWKSSSRTNKILVRRYFAEKKHNVLFVCDNGVKMSGDTPAGEAKAELALAILGVSAYLFDKQGVNYAMALSDDRGNMITRFMSGAMHLEGLLSEYKKALNGGEPVHSLRQTLEKVSDTFSRRMILVVITDKEGLAEIDEILVRRLALKNDVYIFKLEDAYLTTPDAFDIQANRWEDPFLTMDERMHREELAQRADMDAQAERLMTPHRVLFRNISREEEIVDALAELFRRRKGGMRA